MSFFEESPFLMDMDMDMDMGLFNLDLNDMPYHQYSSQFTRREESFDIEDFCGVGDNVDNHNILSNQPMGIGHHDMTSFSINQGVEEKIEHENDETDIVMHNDQKDIEEECQLKTENFRHQSLNYKYETSGRQYRLLRVKDKEEYYVIKNLIGIGFYEGTVTRDHSEPNHGIRLWSFYRPHARYDEIFTATAIYRCPLLSLDLKLKILIDSMEKIFDLRSDIKKIMITRKNIKNDEDSDRIYDQLKQNVMAQEEDIEEESEKESGEENMKELYFCRK